MGVAVVALVVSRRRRGTRAAAESAEAQVERLAAEAVNAYRGADYNRAIELLTRAYEIRQVPALLYNLAKAYDKLGDVEHAYDAYRRYADSADADPKLQGKSEARLVVLEEARRKKAAAQRAVEPKSAAARRAAAAEAGAGRAETEQPLPPTADEIREQLKEERQRERRRDRYIALGLGIGAVAFAGDGDRPVGDGAAAADRSGRPSTAATRRIGARSRTTRILRAGIADGFYAATAVAVGVGAYFLYRGFRPEPTAPSLACGAGCRRRAAAGWSSAGRF